MQRLGLAIGFLLQSEGFRNPPELKAFSSSKHCDGRPAPHRKKKKVRKDFVLFFKFSSEPDHIRNENVSIPVAEKFVFFKALMGVRWWAVREEEF